MSYASTPPPEETTLADIALVEEVAGRTTTLRTVLLSLLGAAAGLAAVVIGIGWFVGAISHTEAGFCGRASTPCTSLSVESVETYASVDLPDGAEITNAYYLAWSSSMVSAEASDDARFSAVVRLPADAQPLTLGSHYAAAAPSDEVPEGVLARWDTTLDNIIYSTRLDDNDPTDPVQRTALRGVDADGRLVYEFTATPASR